MPRSMQVEVKKVELHIQDFEDILNAFIDGADYVLDFSMAETVKDDVLKIQSLLQKMVDRSHRLVLLAPSCFEKITDGVSSSKFYFILKPTREAVAARRSDLEALIVDLTEEFWGQFLPAKVEETLTEPVFAQACVKICKQGRCYQYHLVLSESGLQYAVEKILLIPIDSSPEDYKDLAAELLNLMCGHLRAKISQGELDVKDVNVGIPFNVEGYGAGGRSLIRNWLFETETESFEIRIVREVKNVPA